VPIEVDVQARLEDLARATLEVAAQRGTEAVTFREVAAAMDGGSTKRVTNYLPTRAALLSNAVTYVLQRWAQDVREELVDVPPADQLRTMAMWGAETRDGDELVRRMFVEMVVRPGHDGEMDAIRQDAREHRDQLLDVANAAHAQDADFAADLVFLLLRGFYLAALEDPELWDSDRALPIVERAISLLVS
jgi:AcrR family transcriptional regulator